jgi:hypothetical protein
MYGQVAQLVEQRTENPRVGGSIPPLATIISKAFSRIDVMSRDGDVIIMSSLPIQSYFSLVRDLLRMTLETVCSEGSHERCHGY